MTEERKEAIEALTCGLLDTWDIDPYLDTILEALENDEEVILKNYHAWLLEQFVKNPTSDNLHSIDTAIGWLKAYAKNKDINICFGVEHNDK